MSLYRKNGYLLTSRTCTVCGANIRYGRNSLTTTCDNTCTRARKNGISREIQAERDTMNAGSYAGITSEHRENATMLRMLWDGDHTHAEMILNNLD